MSAPFTVDRYDLYELAVQAPNTTARFLRAVHGADPRTLGEDFCGIASISRAWVSLFENAEAIGVDRDPRVIAEARRRAQMISGEASQRISFACADVRNTDAPADVVCALNFGLCEFHERPSLVRYLSVVRARLRLGGVAVFDLYGGPGALVTSSATEKIQTEAGEFAYTWTQREINALTGRVLNSIDFELPDGSVIADAFTYDWRLWSIPEVADALADAEFATMEVYDRYADAIDETGAMHISPSDPSGCDLEEDYVVYIVARVE